jgi:hypothetical protein
MPKASCRNNAFRTINSLSARWNKVTSVPVVSPEVLERRPIGEGGYGSVFEATYRGKAVAVKSHLIYSHSEENTVRKIRKVSVYVSSQ